MFFLTDIQYGPTMTRVEILSLARRHNRQDKKTYKIDTLAHDNGLTVVRLPPYHCFFNPIELTWAFTKNYVATNNTDGKLKRVGELFKDARKICINKRMWVGWTKHVRTEEDNYWKFDKIIETVPNITVHVGGDSDDEDISDEEQDDWLDVVSDHDDGPDFESDPLQDHTPMTTQTTSTDKTVPLTIPQPSKKKRKTSTTERCLICYKDTISKGDDWRGCDRTPAHWYHKNCLTRYLSH